jgi:hypothetical protein
MGRKGYAMSNAEMEDIKQRTLEREQQKAEKAKQQEADRIAAEKAEAEAIEAAKWWSCEVCSFTRNKTDKNSAPEEHYCEKCGRQPEAKPNVRWNWRQQQFRPRNTRSVSLNRPKRS